ncbi:MAG: integrase [Alphaproteobacteria bacterium]|nr:integrase [Alphaproteobacteria bacterium]
MPKYLQTCIEPYLESFAETFAAENYTAGTVKAYQSILRKVGHAMDLEGIKPSGLTLDMAERLGRKVPRKNTGTIWPHKLACRFAQHLLNIGVTHPVSLTEAQQARATLLADFETYLVKHRGLSSRSIYQTLRITNRFIDHRFGDAVIDPGRLRPTDVISFIEHVLAGIGRNKTAVTHVRIFLQYLFANGAIESNLALSVPKATKRWGARLPRHLSPEGIEAVLSYVRDNPRHGARDYAMLLIMARLGLRAIEVIGIQLDDIDWRAGELLVRGKGKLHDRLPISAEVGEALSRYLREERGPASCRTLFVTHRAPHRPFKDSQIINTVLKDALKATGQKPLTPFVGSRLLRHSLATQLVNSGASLDEVGDVLRHRSRTSTMIYARLDIDGLRSVAMPWPVTGGEQ